MTILLTDTIIERLRCEALLLHDIAPDSFVMSASDPLMAAKFALANPIDVLIAELYMPRINGLQLRSFVLDKSPNARICLMATSERFDECPEICDSGVLRLPFPITAASLTKALPI